MERPPQSHFAHKSHAKLTPEWCGICERQKAEQNGLKKKVPSVSHSLVLDPANASTSELS
eukprot:578897-Hanusia_phi.AAC.1